MSQGFTSQLPIPLPVAQGGTNVSSVTIAPTASSWAGWDTNSNLSAANFIPGYTTTATAAGTTTLIVASNRKQYFTGTTTQTVQMPITSTLVLGQSWVISNASTGLVTITSSGSNTILVLNPSQQVTVTCILTSGTTAASWSVGYVPIITDWVAYTPTFTGFGTPSSVQIYSRRIGDTLEIRGVFTSGTSTATEARMTLGYQGTNANVTSSSTKISALQLAGVGAVSIANSVAYYTLIESNIGYITFGVQSALNGGLTKVNGNVLVVAGVSFSITAAIPINTWP